MKKLIFLFFLINSLNLTAQNMGEWTWMKGSDTLFSPGVFGTKGVPDTSNYPPALYESCSWTDTAGNFWMFGGVGIGVTAFNTLWKFTPQNNIWTWISGSNLNGDLGNKGIKGIPSATNCPSARGWGIMCWSDKNNNLWLYGGVGGNSDVFQDLWKYNITSNEWTWMSGTDTPPNITNFGIKGVASINNNPPQVRENNCVWVDDSNNLWFFGGLDEWDDYYNDLWNYKTSTNEWTWIYGNALPNTPINFGQKGIPDTNNNPGGRCSYSSFKDNLGNLYFFGSWNNFVNLSLLNDIWKYNTITNTWTWVSGDIIINGTGNYGSICNADINIAPRSRLENRSSWSDSCGLWIFGGWMESWDELSDLWRYNFTNNMWTRISGTMNLNEPTIYNSYQISTSSNKPGGRGGSVSWTDKKGNLWLFGGLKEMNLKNDLWRYVPDTNCAKCIPKSNPPIPNSDTLNPEIKIPNIFTPNADGINDKFEIIAKNYKSYYLQVFNRWGVLVFESKDTATLWDGTIHNRGNACSDGVYFYILNLIDFKQNTTQYKGSITILR